MGKRGKISAQAELKQTKPNKPCGRAGPVRSNPEENETKREQERDWDEDGNGLWIMAEGELVFQQNLLQTNSVSRRHDQMRNTHTGT